ncbi:MAG: septal ring lytic transglycosylase RlpA family protein [Gemmatimonadales bacterium]
MSFVRGCAGAASALAVAGCTLVGGPAVVPPPPAGLSSIADPVPYSQPASASGNMVQYEQGGRTYRVLDSSFGYDERGLASWYGEEFNGRSTSSGETFDMYALTGAHRTLPIPTYVRVTNLANGRSVIVRVNDRGPFRDPDNRIIDVSYAAAVRLDMLREGTANVRVQAVEPWQYRVR